MDDVIRIVLVDDHALVRQGVRELLETERDLRVVGEAGDSDTAITVIVRERPAVVLLDVEIVGDDVNTTVARLAKLVPEARILILSMYDGPHLLQRLLSLGIRGYLLKSASRDELVSAIRTIHSDPSRVVLGVSRGSLASVHSGRDSAALSSRELTVLELTALALTNAQIASRLYVTEATVKRHLTNIFAKLGANSRIDAVNKAIDARLITPARHPSQGSPPTAP